MQTENSNPEENCYNQLFNSLRKGMEATKIESSTLLLCGSGIDLGIVEEQWTLSSSKVNRKGGRAGTALYFVLPDGAVQIFISLNSASYSKALISSLKAMQF